MEETKIFKILRFAAEHEVFTGTDLCRETGLKWHEVRDYADCRVLGGFLPSPQRRRKVAAAQEQVGLHGDRQVDYGPPAASLIRIAEELRAELLVVGTAFRTGLKRALLGSVAEAVVRAAPFSVLVVQLHQQ